LRNNEKEAKLIESIPTPSQIAHAAFAQNKYIYINKSKNLFVLDNTNEDLEWKKYGQMEEDVTKFIVRDGQLCVVTNNGFSVLHLSDNTYYLDNIVDGVSEVLAVSDDYLVTVIENKYKICKFHSSSFPPASPRKHSKQQLVSSSSVSFKTELIHEFNAAEKVVCASLQGHLAAFITCKKILNVLSYSITVVDLVTKATVVQDVILDYFKNAEPLSVLLLSANLVLVNGRFVVHLHPHCIIEDLSAQSQQVVPLSQLDSGKNSLLCLSIMPEGKLRPFSYEVRTYSFADLMRIKSEEDREESPDVYNSDNIITAHIGSIIDPSQTYTIENVEEPKSLDEALSLCDLESLDALLKTHLTEFDLCRVLRFALSDVKEEALVNYFAHKTVAKNTLLKKYWLKTLRQVVKYRCNSSLLRQSIKVVFDPEFQRVLLLSFTKLLKENASRNVMHWLMALLDAGNIGDDHGNNLALLKKEIDGQVEFCQNILHVQEASRGGAPKSIINLPGYSVERLVF